MNYEYKEEFFNKDLIDELGFLTEMSWKEANCAPDADYNPDWEKYTELNEANILRLYTVRFEDLLVGYLTFIVGPTLHSRQLVHALHDSMYILKHNRKGGTAKGLISFAEADFRREGVNTMVMTVMVHRDFSVTLKQLGFKQSESSFIKGIS